MQNDSSNKSTLCVRLYAIRNYFSFMLDILHELSHMSVYRFFIFLPHRESHVHCSFLLDFKFNYLYLSKSFSCHNKRVALKGVHKVNLFRRYFAFNQTNKTG